MSLRSASLRLAKGGPEQQAIEAGEIDAIVDHATSNIILLPAARHALRELASGAHVAHPKTADEPPIANRLLAALPRAEYQSLLAGLEPLTLKFGEVLHEPGVPIRHVYFPVDCLISLRASIADHRAPQVGLVGHEGVVGAPFTLGIDASLVRALVLAPGIAARMSVARLNKAVGECPSFQRGLHGFAHAMLAMARQTVVCNCFHSVEARLARWLLMVSDRVRSERLFLTQADLAEMLGVRRATINDAVGPLQLRRLIGWRRGKITILDRKGLKAASCRCYEEL